jgi:hypothetical protein
LNDPWLPSVENFWGGEPSEEREGLFSFSPEYYSKEKMSFFPFSGMDHIVYNQ